MPDLERARAKFEARAIVYGLDIAKYTNGHDYDSEETQRYWLGFCWAWPEFKECKMEIDWNEAPEGATHHNYDCSSPWLRDGERPAYFRHGELVEYMNPNTGRAHINEVYSVPCPAAAPAVPAWPGAGLPPVGTVCEVWYDDGRVCWHECEVIYHKSDDPRYAAVRLRGEHHDKLEWAGCFRPIRTPERIASEEVLEEIERLYSEGGPAAVFDAGYRKQA